MALGRQKSPVQALVTFCLWAERKGYSVGEMHGFGTVHPVHTRGSWHYDREGRWGKAADINWRRSGEPARLRTAAAKAIELGLGVIYAQYGTNGPAASHRTHLHVDVGPYSNLGRGSFAPRGGGDILTENVQRAVRTKADQIWGEDTDRRVSAVRMSSRHKGGRFPRGVKFTQRVVGASDDGVWGKRSSAAHDATTRAIQRALNVSDDGIWGPATDKAYRNARDLRRRV